MKEQLERYRLCQQSLDAASRKLREEEDSLAEAGEVSGCDPTPAGASGPAPRERQCSILLPPRVPAFFA